ncbi:uncharacterized protein UV8b_02123 [Ustilaginoidea virens]|uniref:Uncharacterized protein n=1 Tax=Ustilaginoidea virens TaxID=1159556 RepID=A0A8E5MFJ7_USTVR|nr:uncharacterized protein UV8b_02123 [Ustilaginoidea virens]QUC17882.1 hypothetical protein UV8b_02123 [Ustilaginoidea virens]
MEGTFRLGRIGNRSGACPARLPQYCAARQGKELPACLAEVNRGFIFCINQTKVMRDPKYPYPARATPAEALLVSFEGFCQRASCQKLAACLHTRTRFPM